MAEPNPTDHCRYHCRGCGSHFTSLQAFDAHHGRLGSAADYDFRPCAWPEMKPGYRMLTRTGSCAIGDPLELREPVSIHYLDRPGSRPGAARQRLAKRSST